jgi:hypothetical protein
MLDGAGLSNAINAVNTMAQRYAAAMLHCPMTREELLDAMFEQEVIRKCTDALGLTCHTHSVMEYDLGQDVSLWIDYAVGGQQRTLPISRDHIRLQPGFAPMAQLIARTTEIYDKFEEVKALVRYLNLNATPSSARYYWPPILQLCGDHRAFEGLKEAPGRYTTPREINKYLQVMRDTTSTMGQVALLPRDDITTRGPHQIWLTFRPRTFTRGDIQFRGDQVRFFF